jgi:type VI secretion system protein ImpJ
LIQSSKVLWGEGLFLRPQHFQQQDAYHEWRLAEMARAFNLYPWGVRRVKVDTDALQSNVLRLVELQAIFPDGEIFNAPAEDELPPPVSLTDVPMGSSELVIHAALAPMRPNGSNFAGAQQRTNDSAVRFLQKDILAPDLFTQATAADVATLRRTCRLLPDHEPREHLVHAPLLRLKRNAGGSFELDGRFIPPSLAIGSSAALMAVLRRLIDALQAKVEALYGSHREPSKHVIEFRSGDIASFWLLHTASSACAALMHIHQHPAFHPERLYARMMELAGSLMTFSKLHGLADLPPYQHGNPGPSFLKLDSIIRELLETVISTRYFAIALTESKPGYHLGRLESDKINSSTSFYLGISAAMPPSELVEAMPSRVKVGSPDDVEKLVLSAMAGVRITHAPQVPAAIPVRPGAYYFALDARGPLYERMLQSQSIMVYTPSGIADLQLELFALNQ